MIIKSLIRRHERWNPVHPTIGAYWGVGVGIGCGIGWGPGFGHEVVGYVGAGCGAGFHIGITLLGVGIGFPANYLYTAPHTAFLSRKGSLDGSLTRNTNMIEDGWAADRSHISGAEQSRGAPFSGFKIGSLKHNLADFSDVRRMLDSHAKHITHCLHRGSGVLFSWDRGLKSRLDDP